MVIVLLFLISLFSITIFAENILDATIVPIENDEILRDYFFSNPGVTTTQ